ncbi:MAG: hypothetical protein LBB56_06620 [Chitinispirillales bacterium]|jgi:hypothetical protein|nr:hypothetical protein [Chitinispirillales bacterium]
MKSVEQMINERAFAIYEKRVRDGLHGDSNSDYYQAAKEVTAEIEKRNAGKVKAFGAEKKAVKKEETAPKAQVKSRVSAAAPAAKTVVKAEPKIASSGAASAKKKVVKKKASR